MLTEKLTGLSLDDASAFSIKLINELQDKDTQLTLPPEDDLHSLSGVKVFPSRIRCATLPWEALLAAFAKELGKSEE